MDSSQVCNNIVNWINVCIWYIYKIRMHTLSDVKFTTRYLYFLFQKYTSFWTECKTDTELADMFLYLHSKTCIALSSAFWYFPWSLLCICEDVVSKIAYIKWRRHLYRYYTFLELQNKKEKETRNCTIFHYL